jgi:hypothetical protein
MADTLSRGYSIPQTPPPRSGRVESAPFAPLSPSGSGEPVQTPAAAPQPGAPSPEPSGVIPPHPEYGIKQPIKYNRDSQLLLTPRDPGVSDAPDLLKMAWPRNLSEGGTPLPMNATLEPEEGERVDAAHTFDERAHIDWWEVRSTLYGAILPTKLKPNDLSMLQNARALRTHRQWGGVDGRQIQGTVDAVKTRQEKDGSRPPLYAPAPAVPEEMPFDPRDMPEFIYECQRRLQHDDCHKIIVHGRECPVIALYGMPSKPFQEIYESNQDVMNRAMCMGFGDVKALDARDGWGLLKELAQREPPPDRQYKAKPSNYTQKWTQYVDQGKTPPSSLVVSGSSNLSIHVDRPESVTKVFPGPGFWKDPLINKRIRPAHGMEIYRINPLTHMAEPRKLNDAEQRSLFLGMAMSSGCVLRGPKPVPSAMFSWTKPSPEQHKRARKRSEGRRKNDYARGYPELGPVCAEAYTTLTAAACGIHPPVFACLITVLPDQKGAIMLMLTERGMNTLHSPSNSGVSADTRIEWPITLGVEDPPRHHLLHRSSGAWLDENGASSGYYRKIVSKHVSNRFSDLLFRSSMLGFLAGDIKEGNLVAMRPYKIDDLGITRSFGVGKLPILQQDYAADMICDFGWIPFDVMHIDCDPRYACFIPRSVHSRDARLGYTPYVSIAEAEFYVLMYTGSGKYTPDEHLSRDDKLVVNSTCLRLIMLFLTVLHAFCGSFTASDNPTERRNQMLSLETSYSQLFTDIFGILRDHGDHTFGAICNELLGEEAFSGLFENTIDRTEKRALQKEVMEGWNTVTNLSKLEEGVTYHSTKGLWSGIAKIVKNQLHHYWLNETLVGKAKPVPGMRTADGKPVMERSGCPTKIFEDVNDGVNIDEARQPTNVTQTAVTFSMVTPGDNVEELAALIIRIIRDKMKEQGIAPSEDVAIETLDSKSDDYPDDTVFTVILYFNLQEDAEKALALLTEELQEMDSIEQFFEQMTAFQPIMPEIRQVADAIEGLPAGAKGWHATVLQKLREKHGDFAAEYGGKYQTNMLMMLVGFLGYGVSAVGRNVKTPTVPSTSTPRPTGSS